MAKILDDKEYQEEILNRIRQTGMLKNCWDGICKEPTFFDYKKNNQEFSKSTNKAIKDFKKTLWKERPDLKLKAIAGLEKNLESWEQVVRKEHFEVIEDEKGNQIEKLVKVTVSKWTRSPQKWAIEHVLQMNKLDGDDLPDDNAMEAVDFEFEIIDEKNINKYRLN